MAAAVWREGLGELDKAIPWLILLHGARMGEDRDGLRDVIGALRDALGLIQTVDGLPALPVDVAVGLERIRDAAASLHALAGPGHDQAPERGRG